MDMISGDQIRRANLADWRKLAQGLHARFLVEDFSAAVGLLQAVSALGADVDEHLRVRLGRGFVDCELVSDHAIYRDDAGTEHTVEWVTQLDIDLARRISDIAAEQLVRADPSAVSELELGLDTVSSASVAPVWAALLTGDAGSMGRGTPGDEIRDSTVRVPNLWFDEVPSSADGHHESRDQGQRFHVEVYVAPEVVAGRIAAVLAAGGTIVDDSQSPGLTVLADPAGNRGVLCASVSSDTQD